MILIIKFTNKCTYFFVCVRSSSALEVSRFAVYLLARKFDKIFLIIRGYNSNKTHREVQFNEKKRKHKICSLYLKLYGKKSNRTPAHTDSKVCTMAETKWKMRYSKYVLAPGNFHNSWKFHDKLLFFIDFFFVWLRLQLFLERRK